MFKLFLNRFKKVYTFRHALLEMTIKQLKIKYAGSMLGIWWAVITPLILTMSIYFVFEKVFKVNIPHNAFFILAGIIPWFFFSNALQEAANSFIVNTPVLKQGIFPRELIPISTVLANLLNFLIGLCALLPFFIFLNIKSLNSLILLLPLIAFNLIFILGLGILFSCINIFFRDFSHFLNIAFLPWFWVTPIFYSLDMVPLNLQWICKANPMTYYISSYQSILIKAEAPALFTILVLIFLSLGSFVIGYLFFIKNESVLLKRA
ncbi:MAG: ABC transporter permease [Candidatus Omnitrophica bacterium]|nr:ABC transporter permease [Candidatus Omnitrophota bacterium]MDD5609941.1 ABC transporter permease [Candidatus Omnitrophota bacterium]